MVWEISQDKNLPDTAPLFRMAGMTRNSRTQRVLLRPGQSPLFRCCVRHRGQLLLATLDGEKRGNVIPNLVGGNLVLAFWGVQLALHALAGLQSNLVFSSLMPRNHTYSASQLARCLNTCTTPGDHLQVRITQPIATPHAGSTTRQQTILQSLINKKTLSARKRKEADYRFRGGTAIYGQHIGAARGR
jgi:hypothetical protein